MSNPFLKQVFNKDKTFRPKRKFEPGTQRFELHKKAQASLNAGLDLKLAVQLPAGEELNDWVAVHVVDFFNRVNLIYGTISDGCTERSCPVMSGGPKYEYRWQDEHRFRRPTALSAPRYMDLLMDWIEVQINNEDVFPTNVALFSEHFLCVCQALCWVLDQQCGDLGFLRAGLLARGICTHPCHPEAHEDLQVTVYTQRGTARQAKHSFAGLKDGPSQVCPHPLMWSPFPANNHVNSWEATWGGNWAYKPVWVRLHDSWVQDREAQKESHGRS
ncbi:MOB kinase activator 3A isoform X1 [Monodon monoceros]|uniref:MOB kinase activator 3A isoform X1 n=1 Tax=Monodon monoceros TaxID=40151 RepID=UPI0010F5EE5F|nr:MOB kinase activator 3A isoform X1 [Monodon monoceros]XP_029074321.1 MOB kinase activator 3A isoform X1 [Monodon monoceros]XP_029074322.1 MOB kinase activator 3A isoform X1 [Monodon monoceros]